MPLCNCATDTPPRARALQCHGLCCTDDGYCPDNDCGNNLVGVDDDTCDMDDLFATVDGGCDALRDWQSILYYAFCDYTEYGGGLEDLGRVRCKDPNGATYSCTFLNEKKAGGGK
jgi:hypothetical protein